MAGVAAGFCFFIFFGFYFLSLYIYGPAVHVSIGGLFVHRDSCCRVGFVLRVISVHATHILGIGIGVTRGDCDLCVISDGDSRFV
jgi:hypothetical protein